MKQITQVYRTGKVKLLEVPEPVCAPRSLLVQTHASVVSAGTEKAMLELAQKSLLGKARARPDLVRVVLDRARTEGIPNVVREAWARLNALFPLGYSSAGHVLEVGAGVASWHVGDRVACGGTFAASHAEVAVVPCTLAVRVPDALGDEEAAFAFLGAIALHGIRTGAPKPGERVAVIGAGLLGLLAVQMLKAFGCRVLVLEPQPERAALGRRLGADEAAPPELAGALQAARAISDGRGVDCVLVYASSSSAAPLKLAAEITAERGTVVLVGNVPVEAPRKLLYEKEVRLCLSRSAGPGIYDPAYEAGTADLNSSYVRWSASRNMEYFLELVAHGQVAVRPLITHCFPIEQALEAYERLLSGESCIGAVLRYPSRERSRRRTVQVAETPLAEREGVVVIRAGVVGAGQFARGTLLPCLRRMKQVELRAVCARTGLSARDAAERFGIRCATTDFEELLRDSSIDAILVATRHDLHASMVCAARGAGKAVYVEKPLAISWQQLSEILDAYAQPAKQKMADVLVVGFNRRYSAAARAVKQFLSARKGPLSVLIRINAGAIDPSHWTQDPAVGGGRIVGEVCHFIDLVQFFCDALPARIFAEQAAGDDDVILTMKMTDGSVGTVVYATWGDKAYPRERVEVFGRGSVCVIDNFRRVEMLFGSQRKILRSWTAERGHRAILEDWREACLNPEGFRLAQALESYATTTAATFAAIQSLQTQSPVEVELPVSWPQNHGECPH